MQNYFEDWNQDAKRVAAQNRPLRYRGKMTIFRDSDRKSIKSIHVQHYVNVGAAITHVDDVVMAHRNLSPEMIEDRDFSVARTKSFNADDLASIIEVEQAGKDVTGRYDFLQGCLHYVLGVGRNYVEREARTFDLLEYLREQSDIRLEAHSLACLARCSLRTFRKSGSCNSR